MAGWLSGWTAQLFTGSAIPSQHPVVTRAIRAELGAARRDGCRVVLLTGNHNGQLRALDRYRRAWRGRWRVITPPNPGLSIDTVTTDALRRLLPGASTSMVTTLIGDGMGGPLIALSKAATNAVAKRIVGQQPPTLDGIPAHIDAFLRYLREYASKRPTIVGAELSGPTTLELLQALAIFVKNTPELQVRPVVVVIGLDEIAVEQMRHEGVLVAGKHGLTCRQDYLPDLRAAVLALSPLDARRIRDWLGRVEPAVVSTLLMASGRDDLEAAHVWQRWKKTGVVTRRSAGWSLSRSGWTEAADQLEVTLHTRVSESDRPVARRILYAAALFGLNFGRTPVVAAVANDMNMACSAVGDILSLLCDLHIFQLAEGTGADHISWSDPRFRDHVLHDAMVQVPRIGRSLPVHIIQALTELTSAAAMEHRTAAVRLSRLHHDSDSLVRLSRIIEDGRDQRLGWSALLTLSRLNEPSAGLAQDLATAAIDAKNSGYLQMATALAEAGVRSIRAVAKAGHTIRLVVLGMSGRALNRSSTTRERAVELMQEALGHLNGASDALPLSERVRLEHELGVALRDVGQLDAGISHLQTARRLQEHAAAGISDARAPRRLARTLYELGAAYKARDWTGTDTRRMDEAIQLFQAARRALLETDSAMPPSEVDIRDAANCLFNEAIAWWAVGAEEPLIERQLTAVATELRSLSTRLPTPDIQHLLAQVELELHRCHVRQARVEAADAAAARALAHARNAFEADSSPKYARLVEAAVDATRHYA